MSNRPKGAHEYAVYEQQIKTYVTLGDEWFKLRGREIVNIDDKDRAFLIEWGHLPEPCDSCDEEADVAE